ncbi:SEC-C domain-containing protein [Lutibacter sp.]|uniref:SEC-C domain-containing protein n=1 Tax=Lutibacter sp. TaxID=1925666 RepID=UPI0025BF3FFD|nr:SEC-C domain-containing protein [Lutibacter sp.]MCF6168650.1 SEC-C domain-containing protein [Lutibacter sp.]
MKNEKILKRLNELTSSYSFIYILVSIVITDFCGTIDELFLKNVREHLNDKEFSFLVGLWLKNLKKDNLIEEEKLEAIYDEVYKLMDSLHLTFMSDFKFDSNDKTDIFDKFSKGSLLQETIIYAGTGAYDNQYKKLSTQKYKYDEKWILENKGFSINCIESFYDNLKSKLQTKLNDRKFLKKLKSNEALLDLFCLTKLEITKKNTDFENLFNCLITDVSDKNNIEFNDLGDFNIFSAQPIIKISKDRYFIPSAFAVSEALYESPFYWMLNDSKYKKIALKNRGDIAEELTANMLETVFEKSNIYQNVLINKTKNETATDIDVLAIHKERAIIFQIKSKKLTSLSKQGDLESIKDDFKKAVQDTFEQGLKSKSCLLNYENFKFKDDELVGKISKIKEYNIVTIVLDDYPGISHQVHILLGKKSNILPVSINIFDLEILLKYLRKPDEFIDYISKRVSFSKYYKADNEMCYLGFNLKKGLNKYDADYIVLDESWAQLIDKTYYKEVYREKIQDFSKRKIGRNDSCFCRSGLKYKKCHGKRQNNFG